MHFYFTTKEGNVICHVSFLAVTVAQMAGPILINDWYRVNLDCESDNVKKSNKSAV